MNYIYSIICIEERVIIVELMNVIKDETICMDDGTVTFCAESVDFYEILLGKSSPCRTTEPLTPAICILGCIRDARRWYIRILRLFECPCVVCTTKNVAVRMTHFFRYLCYCLTGEGSKVSLSNFDKLWICCSLDENRRYIFFLFVFKWPL